MTELVYAVTACCGDDEALVEHLIKVYTFAKAIGELEKLNDSDQQDLEAAALTHDIGLAGSWNKFVRRADRSQSQDPFLPARHVMTQAFLPAERIERVSDIVKRYQSDADPTGLVQQILLEADFIVSAKDQHLSDDAIRQVRDAVFVTPSGKAILERLYVTWA